MARRLSRALVAMTAVASTLTTAGVAGTAPAAAADPAIPDDPSVPVASGTVLPFSASSPGDVVVDEPHGHVFVSGGKTETGIVVADLDGKVVDTIPGLSGPDGMLLSDDGSTLYVALATGHGIAAVDTATLGVTTYDTGDSCPRDLTQTGSELYFTASCGGSSGDVFFTLSRLDPSSGDVTRVTLYGSQGTLPDQGFYYAGPIVSDPAYPGRLFVVDQWDFDGNVRAFDLDATGVDATLTDSTGFGHDAVAGLDFSKDHTRLLAATAGGVLALDPADLSQHSTFAYSGDLAVATGAGFVASADTEQATVNRTDGSYGRTYFFDGPAFVGYDSVAWAGDRLFVVAWDQTETLRLFTFTDYATPAPSLYGTATGGHVVGEPHQVKVSLDLDGQPFAGKPARAWRSGPDGLVDIGSDPDDVAVTDSDGVVTINDTPAVKGTYRYTYLYDGEAGVAPQKWSFTQRVTGLSTVLTLDRPPVFTRDEPLHLQGSVVTRSDGSPLGDVPVSLTDTFGGQTRVVDPVRTGADGRFAFDLPPGELGDHVFRADYAGDSTHEPSNDSDHLWVKHAVSLALTPPPAPLVSSQPMVFHGTLTDDDGLPVPGASVTWQRWTGDPASVTKSATVVTGADGGFTFTDQSTGRGMVRWTATFKGDASRDVGNAEVSSPVYSFFPPLEIRTDRTIYDYGSQATVEAWANDGVHGTVRLYAQPDGGTRSLLAEGPTVVGRDAVATLQATRNTALTLAFEPEAGNYAYAPDEVSSRLAVRPLLDQRLRGSWGKDGRTFLVHTSVDPRLTLTVQPRLPGRCVRVRVERYRDGAYRLKKLTACIPLDSYSRATWTLTGSPASGARFRLRYLAPGDPAYSGAKAPWAYVRFTR